MYDAEGNRVAKGTLSQFSCDPAVNGFVVMSEYVLGPGGEVLSEVDGSGSFLHTDVYAAGSLVASYDSQYALHFHLNDWLGTRRVQTGWNGAIERSCTGGSFGDLLNCTGYADATIPSEINFTGKQRQQDKRSMQVSTPYLSGNA